MSLLGLNCNFLMFHLEKENLRVWQERETICDISPLARNIGRLQSVAQFLDERLQLSIFMNQSKDMAVQITINKH